MKLTKALMKRCIAENRAFAAKSVARLTTEETVEGRQASLTLQLLEFVAKGMWASADLHFDGDCFQEHEWHVIMRSGSFTDVQRMHASGKTALEAVLAAADARLKDSKRWMDKKDYLHHWNQIDIWRRIAEALEARLPIVRKMDSDAQTAGLKEQLEPTKSERIAKALTKKKK